MFLSTIDRDESSSTDLVCDSMRVLRNPFTEREDSLELFTYVEDAYPVPVVGVTVQVVPSTGVRVHVSAVLVPPSVVGLTPVPIGVT